MQALVIFGVVTLVLTYLSRKSLLKPGVHGFYRFFVWESILGMISLIFLADPKEPNSSFVLYVISSLLLNGSLVLVVISLVKLLRTGKPDKTRNEVPMLEFEKTTVLVQDGIYRYIRHPMYGSLFLLCWGVFFKYPTLLQGVLALTGSAFLIATAKAEEKENLNYFGEAYREYMKKTKKFVPFIL